MTKIVYYTKIDISFQYVNHMDHYTKNLLTLLSIDHIIHLDHIAQIGYIIQIVDSVQNTLALIDPLIIDFPMVLKDYVIFADKKTITLLIIQIKKKTKLSRNTEKIYELRTIGKWINIYLR